ncbi:GhoT/OrtT family toxin [Yersinia ruckeri]|uniref:GhoT/OrtT family toxin n=1 Tax=Yersinia ruckeri TaxID=29486 RepID=UPI00057181BF|nr:GhoT/OrtT family toxin [Yersinia ruckeri]AKA37415.1 membrane protein [Yersinia ruckeri]EKN3346484.1 GhoT/OrtT family toxin [Yersinia ruckeri]EKN3360980.1 GhoT/OrtT family toxin [Yersinia ruckeri]EKN3363443.1 GhoT/OrtT family toxin [Yersinia ruckeri]EKN4181172.1 GhoT/OrtT family toxin [Yersinia ruckeri]
MSSAWIALKTIYWVGMVISILITFFASVDPSWKIRIFTALLIGLTWPMSLPVVLLFLLF